MRFEHRPEEKEKPPNGLVNGESSANAALSADNPGEHAGDVIHDDRVPPATFLPESNGTVWKSPAAKQDYAQLEERTKAELRHLGFLGQDVEPDYDAHYDDEVGQRLRLLQSELKKQMIINGARKARLAQIAEEYMGYQEFAHIRDDLDTQVVQAFSKRNRTLGKGKKNNKRPGGAGGGSHFSGANGASSGISRPGIGDAARAIMDRRRRWNNTISPIFSGEVTKVRGPEDSIFRDEDMQPFINAEKERLEEEAD
jgi:transcriptional adapter 3